MNDLFIPDTIFPDQYHARRIARPLMNHRALYLAIIDSAIDDLHTSIRTGRKTYYASEVLEWLQWPDHGEPVSFRLACEVVGFDADWLGPRLLGAYHRGDLGRLSQVRPTSARSPQPGVAG